MMEAALAPNNNHTTATPPHNPNLPARVLDPVCFLIDG